MKNLALSGSTPVLSFPYPGAALDRGVKHAAAIRGCAKFPLEGSGEGAKRAVAAFGKAWSVLKARAENVAREQVSTEFGLIKKAQSALTDLISKLSPDARAKTDPEVKSFAQAVGQLTHLIERRGASGSAKKNQTAKQ